MKIYNVLFLCTGNSARSIMAEALLNARGNGRFRAHSAGSFPKGQVHPLAVETLARRGIPTDGLRSKSWNEFAVGDPPPIDFVFTVCDNAASEVCPVWPGHPATAHWSVPDPAAEEGPDEVKRAAFVAAFDALTLRIAALLDLQTDELDRGTLEARLREIGMTAESAS